MNEILSLLLLTYAMMVGNDFMVYYRINGTRKGYIDEWKGVFKRLVS